mmetsp:Transcript_22119/g.61195  ORF Transcript_22119/g.61195 Transcript_22119/m.61195 type:complete len:233 (-) Transcript_22119:2324-3022(-)
MPGLLEPPPQDESRAEGPIEKLTIASNWQGAAASLRHEDRALIRPPVPLLLLERPPLHPQVQWPALLNRPGCVVTEPSLQVQRRLEELPQDVVQIFGGAHHYTCRARAVAQLQHHEILPGETKLCSDSLCQICLVPALKACLPGHDVRIAIALRQVMCELLVRGHDLTHGKIRVFLVRPVILQVTPAQVRSVTREFRGPPLPSLQNLHALEHRPCCVVLDVQDAPETRRQEL